MPIVRGIICDKCGLMIYWDGNISKGTAACFARKKRLDDWKTVFMPRLQENGKRKAG